ncbi:ATP-binding cassette domain-containing protein [Hyphomicrobium sp. xq]|uniref:ATP-binding cassette domain-containing protein n=1 Tax=Hyphomicrobium album TaxID=2665159 RepID=A0A6I3KIH3_9HYPH|nr:ABC transporter ATP-binding protein [Hyphomicrobium album]MTD95525.1 ATP-binding cassette domain-containing protein [Hyphomicrobium album]
MTPAPAAPLKTPAGPLALSERQRGVLKRFMREWIYPRWRELIVAMVLTWLLAAITGAYPMIIKASFDMLMKDQSGMLPYVLTAIVGATLMRSLLLYAQTVETNRIVMRLSTDMQRIGFAHLMTSDFARMSRDTPGRLVSKLTNDIGFVQGAVQAALNTAIRDALSIVALVASMIYLDPVMSLIVLCVYPIAALPVATLSKKLRKVAKQTQDELGGMTSLLTEKLSGARLIKTFRLEDYASERLNKSFEYVYKLRMKAVINRARIDPLLEALGGIAIAGVIALAYWRIASGISTVGDFMGFVTALLMASQPIRALGNLSGKINEGLAATESFYELVDEKPLIVDKPGAKPLAIADATIRFEHVDFAYEGSGGVHAITNFTLTVPGGRTVALVGRSGAGKSTVLNLVPRLFDVERGSISIDGQDIRDVTLASLRDAISIVAQDVTLFDDTIGANIALGRLGAPQPDIVAAARAAAAHDFILGQPNGYDTEIGDRGLRLSGGQRQRLALARAILKDAPILLLDEATSALDTESERLVQEALARFTKGRTTLVIAHRLSTVQNADLIVVMDDGAIVETGTHLQLLAADGPYARLVRSQALATSPVAETTSSSLAP